MSKSSSFIMIGLGLATALRCLSQPEDLRSTYESILSGRSRPDAVSVVGIVSEDVPKLMPGDTAALVPLIQECLKSSDAAVQKSARIFLLALRDGFDSAQALEPYVPYLTSVLDQKDPGSRKAAIYMLASAYPRPSRAALAALSAHLNDAKNTDEEFVMIASGLLMAFPADSASTRSILDIAGKRSQEHVMGGIIQTIAMSGATDEHALSYVRSGTENANPGVREAAIDAIGRMPRDARAGFAADLQRLISNPNETDAMKERARRVLLQ